MAMLIRVRELQVVSGDSTQETPYSKFCTTGIFLVPDDYDYAAQCCDSSNVEVIAENVPDNVEMGLRDLPRLPEHEDDRCIITATIRCNEMDKEDVLSSIKDWYGGHNIGMSDLKTAARVV
jgi:hypothetical protein